MWDKQKIHDLLESNPRAVERALLAMYELQTSEEQAGHMTKERNGRGFNKHDAEFCTSLVKGLKRYGSLTPRQHAIAKNKMKFYWKQLAAIANARDGIQVPDAQPAPEVQYHPCDCENYDGERLCPACTASAEPKHDMVQRFGDWS